MHDATPRGEGAGTGSRPGPIVLIVDRDDDARFILQHSLGSRGYVTLSTASGSEALTLARSVRPAVIVSELYVPAGDCPCFTYAVRQHEALARVPLIAYSAFAMPADVDWATQAGVQAFVRKPTRLGTLLALIAEHAPIAAPPS